MANSIVPRGGLPRSHGRDGRLRTLRGLSPGVLLLALSLACNQGQGPSPILTTVTTTLTIEGPAFVNPGTTATFRAVVRSYPDHGSHDVSHEVQWLTSNPSVLAIDGGVATAYGAGSVILEVRYHGERSTRSVRVATEYPTEFPYSPVRAIAVGEVVRGTLTEDERVHAFDLTSPADGTLVARLTWDSSDNGTWMWLALDQTEFRSETVWNGPVVARWPVTAGRVVRVTISGGTDWLFDDPFVLTTELE